MTPSVQPPPAIPPRTPAQHRWPRRLLLATLALFAVASLVLWLVLRLLLAPAPGEWQTTARVGPWRVELGVPTLLRLVTSPWLAPALDGRRFASRWGPLRLQWQHATHTLQLHCAPCSLPLPALGEAPVQVPWVTVSVRRSFDAMDGTVIATLPGVDQPVVQVHITGRLRQDGLRLQAEVPSTPIAQGYAVFAAGLPELAHAHIGGTFTLRARVDLPTGRWHVEPQASGFTVQGLGTETLAHAASSCGPSARLRTSDWLTRAVIAAEDQRFFEHPGFDLQELRAAWQLNQRAGDVRRGGSTLNQQLAKLLVAGDERSATRKLRELLYAVEMEQTLGKARILQLYLDNAPWGGGICGAQAAAGVWFGKGARQLTPAQATWLATMLRNPQAAARGWAVQGHIDLPRAERVARGIRGVPGVGARQREAAVKQLQAMATPADP